MCGRYRLCKEQARKRGGDEGRKAVAKFTLFESIVETRTFKQKLDVGAATLQPMSVALHYLEGDAVPLSHVYPIFFHLLAYVQSLSDELSVQDLLDEEDCERMVELVKERWEGTARKKGLKAEVHLLSFVLDPYAQAAVSTATDPCSELFTASALDAARSALRQHVRDPALRASASQQLQLWLAARPTLPPDDPMDEGSPPPTAVASGNNAYSSLYLASSLLVWDKMEARERDVASERIKRPVEEEGVGFELAELLARLKLCPKPTTM